MRAVAAEGLISRLRQVLAVWAEEETETPPLRLLVLLAPTVLAAEAVVQVEELVAPVQMAVTESLLSGTNWRYQHEQVRSAG
jgi:hypothetical protein